MKAKVLKAQKPLCRIFCIAHRKELLLCVVSTQIFGLGLFHSRPGLANPEYVLVSDGSDLLKTPRNSIVVIFNVGTSQKPDYRMRRPGIVPVDSQGKIAWFKDDLWKIARTLPSDRFILEKDMFGPRPTRPPALKGCLPKGGEEVIGDAGVAWLASCSEEILAPLKDTAMRVSYDESRGKIISRFYEYGFKKENNKLFRDVAIKGGPGQTNSIVARDSDLYIRSDVRNFFTLNFSSSDIESKMVDKRIDPLAALASLGFYLKVLFFKITLDLRTDVAFFESSANIPMVMTLPVNAAKRLHRKSGILYSFRLGDGIDMEAIKLKMPVLQANSVDGEFHQEGTRFCDGSCRYELTVPAAGKFLKMQISMNRSLVEHGLFPWFVRDVAGMREAMGWSLSSDLDLTKRVGLYFEVSELPKGSHPWDFWISF